MTYANHLHIDTAFQEKLFKEYPYILRSKENMAKLFNWEIKQWDKFQLTINNLAYKRLLSNAEGQLLDDIGTKLNIKRYDKTDDAYRATIMLRGLRQTSNGSRGDIVKLLKLFFGEEHFYFSKGGLGYAEVTIPPNCFDQAALSVEIDNIFPVNTNLHIKEKNDKPHFCFTDITESQPPVDSGGFSDEEAPDEAVDGCFTDWFFSSKNGYHT